MGAPNGVYIYMHTAHPSISVFDINKLNRFYGIARQTVVHQTRLLRPKPIHFKSQ